MRVHSSTFFAAVVLILPMASAFAQECMLERQVNLSISSTPFPSLPGQPVLFQVFVQPVQGTIDPTGTIQILDALTDLGTFPIKLTQMSVNRTFNEAGAHQMTFIYSGDFNYCSNQKFFGQQVDRITTAVALTSSATSAAIGAPLTFTAQLTPATVSGVTGPAGPVQFLEGTTVLGSSPLAGGKSTLTLSNLEAGTHQIVASLVGDTNWYGVRSAPLAVTVNRGTTTTVLTGTSTPTQVNFTAAVTSSGSVVSSGSVQFSNASTNAVLGTATLPGGTLTVPISQIAGQPIRAAYAGTTSFSPSTSDPIGIPGIANAAGSTPANIAADEIVSLFASFNLGKSATLLTGAPPLPLDLGGTTVTVTDSSGVARQAGLYLAVSGQVNFVVPTATAFGFATITVGGSPAIPLKVNVSAVAPGLFTSGVQVIRVRPDGSQTADTITAATPIDMGADTVYLVLYGTGVRNRSALSAVTCNVGSLNLPALYAGTQPQFPGLDQVNVLLPASLKGAGKVTVTLTADGQVSNAMTLTFQ